MNKVFLVIGVLLIVTNESCRSKGASSVEVEQKNLPDKFLVMLGTAQDAGYPQAGCTKTCCAAYWEGKEGKKYITCLALVDRKANQYWLFEATPDITNQLENVQSYLLTKNNYSPAGIFISHAHIGHYSGLMQLGREVMGAKSIPVWAMPRMDSFLKNNGPWSQLVSLKNIQLQSLKADSTVSLTASLKVTPVKVPHRDEFSETVGFVIESDKKKILFIPDIDKWEKWDKDIVAEVGKVDMALLDGTFYKYGELPGRDMREVPHPFVEESLQQFSSLSSVEKSKIVFIHFNHTNPLLKKESSEKDKVKKQGFGVAYEGMVIEL
ncbi:MAG: MBL fold metallo-hydrolase [Bacteroidota bacterium]|nr:MBL fold metallo-hydrolase [Bacteroidota bacterium]